METKILTFNSLNLYNKFQFSIYDDGDIGVEYDNQTIGFIPAKNVSKLRDFLNKYHTPEL